MRLPVTSLPVLFVACLSLACAPNEQQRRPNFAWVVLDAAAAGHFGLYGYARDTTPSIDRFAEDAIVWEHAYATAPATDPSTASFLTSRIPTAAIRDNRVVATTLAERLREAGYRTHAVSENFWVGPQLGFDRGFEVFDVVASPEAGVVERTLAKVDGSSARPFFLYLHLLPPHTPYKLPEGVAGAAVAAPEGEHAGFLAVTMGKNLRRTDLDQFAAVIQGEAALSPVEMAFIRDRYDDHLAYADTRVAALLKGLEARGDLEDTVVVISADHGEAFGEHGQVFHGTSLYDEQVRVPLIVRVPQAWGVPVPRGTRLPGPVSLMDIAPTLLALAGVDVLPGELEGHDLFAPESPRSEPVRSFVGPEQAIVDGAFKLIVGGDGPRLFDVRADPKESRNLAGEMPERVARMEGLVLPSRQARPPQLPDLDDFDAETRRRLEALGYVDGAFAR